LNVMFIILSMWFVLVCPKMNELTVP